MYKYLAPEPRFPARAETRWNSRALVVISLQRYSGMRGAWMKAPEPGFPPWGYRCPRWSSRAPVAFPLRHRLPFGFVRGLAAQCLAGPCASTSEERPTNT